MKTFYTFLFLTITMLFGADRSAANDCGTAIPLTSVTVISNGIQSGSIEGATWSGVAQCAGPGENPDVWYSFVAAGETSFIRAVGQGDFDPVLEVYDACGGVLLDCRNASGPGGNEASQATDLTVGETYYARVYHAGSAEPTSTFFNVIVGHIPQVELRPQDCDQFTYTTNSIIRALGPPPSSLTVTGYDWEFTELEEPFNTYTVASPNGTNPNYRLLWLSPIQYGRSYDVRIRLRVAEGNSVGDWGPTCSIGLQANVLTTQLQTQFANGNFNFCDVVGADAVGGATQYRWTFNDLSVTTEVFGDNNSRLLRLQKVPGLNLGQVYIVGAYATVGGEESPAGTQRFITMNNFVPNTGLRQDIYPCGQTYIFNSFVQANEVCTAEAYTWRFTNTSQSQPAIFYTRSDGSRFLRLDWLPDLIIGDSYDVDVRAAQGGLLGDYSVTCNITIGASTAGRPVFDTDIDQVPGNGLNLPEESVVFDMTLSGNDGSGDNVQLHITNERNTPVILELYDLSGKLIQTRQETIYGYGDVRWRTGSLPKGIYLLKAFDGTEAVTRKVVL
ncbi:MAG: T9SS type A sorting domain-containing protein [Cryomorphaceae bacterium]|nr:T9SS type A sorting domain-containing protein [Flavobacteriales bacterium]